MASNLHFIEPFISALDAAARINAKDNPNYYAQEPRSLITESYPRSFMTGTGSAIYTSLAPLLESACHQLIIVTCFWARSPSLNSLGDVLRRLSEKVVRLKTEPIRVRLCFSSLSLFQKLFHSQSAAGQHYPPNVWMKKLGLPDPNELVGLDITIKSIFILPFSVMHPKFMIIDRTTVILPSCNVSWEEWFEGAMTLTGPVVNAFTEFYYHFWEQCEPPSARWLLMSGALPCSLTDEISRPELLKSSSQLFSVSTRTVFLPSPHRRNPRLNPIAPMGKVLAPPTPLNTFLLTLFARAERSIRIQTPNVTAPPVLSALLAALGRGIDIQILTSERLMILEQLVTAGTTTSKCMKKLIKRYKALSVSRRLPPHDEESAIAPRKPGRLHISFFEPRDGHKRRGEEAGEPQQSHLKMTMVDGEVVVLGSGNLDRASWFTSQELGVAFFSKKLVEEVGKSVDEAMQGRWKLLFDSE
jgi:phosphatidylserine/phosphatidylglycerophosphate/cardiolipin synthase-like enzyme